MPLTPIQLAMKLKNEGKYSEAAKILEPEVSQEISSSESFLITTLVFCYSRTGQNQKIIDVSKALLQHSTPIAQVNIAASWAIYNLHFKSQKIFPPEAAVELVEEIITLFPQNRGLHPLPLAVFKYVSSLNVTTAAFRVHLLKLINPDMLDAEPKHIAGKDQAFSSDQELYYSHLSKALFGELDFNHCAEVCKLAFGIKLTQRIWFERRYAMCLAKTGRIQEAFDLYLQIAAQKGEWYILFETALAAFRLQDYANAGIYAMQAMHAPGKIESKIHLWELIRNLMNHYNKYELAIELLSLIAAIKHQMHWNISSELRRELSSFNLDLDKLPSFKDIHRSIKEKFSKVKAAQSSHIGHIVKLLPNSVAGFIAAGTQSYYFRASDCQGFKPMLNLKVSFDLIDSFDAKKQQKSQRAIQIRQVP